jgi:Tfp pilus assembly protein PilF
LEPGDARHQLNLAIALAEAGSAEQAISAGEKAISLDRSLRDAYLLVAELYTTSGNRQKSDEILRRFLEFMPQSISVRLMRKLP